LPARKRSAPCVPPPTRSAAPAACRSRADRATLTLNGANGSQLRDWLVEARSSARARPLEANLTRGPQGYSGSIVVALPGASAP